VARAERLERGGTRRLWTAEKTAANRRILDTAVTPGKRLVIVVGQRRALAIAVSILPEVLLVGGDLALRDSAQGGQTFPANPDAIATFGFRRIEGLIRALDQFRERQTGSIDGCDPDAD
jgi:hypothetical protein